MGARFEALDELLDDTLTLPMPCKGGSVKDVVVPSPPAEDGLRIERIMETATQVLSQAESGEEGRRPLDEEALDDAAEADLYRLALGPVHDEILKDARSWATFRHVAMTAVTWIVQGTEAAEKAWKSPGTRPEAQAPNREARRVAAKGSSGTAKSTRSRGSTSGTRVPVRSARKAAATR